MANPINCRARDNIVWVREVKEEDPSKREEDPSKREEDPSKREEDPSKREEDPRIKGGG